MPLNTESNRPGLSDLASEHEAHLARLASGGPPSAVIVVGAGDEPLINEIWRQLPTTNVLTLEPSLVVAKRLLARPGMSSRVQQGRLMVLAGPDYAGAADAWKLFGAVTGMPPIFVEAALERQRPLEVDRAKLAAAKIVLGAKHNDDARRVFAGPYLLNTLTNLPMIAREGDVAALFDLFAGMPAVVVGAGPSLDRNIADLKKHDGRAVVVAVDTAVRPLLAAGIRPHLVVGVDPSEVNARHLHDLPDTRGMWLIGEGSLHPTVFPQFSGHTFVFNVSQHHPWPWLAAHQAERGTLQAWGSVLTTAFDLACRLGCNPIVFAGADLAYTDHLLYCRNTVYESDWSHLDTDEARAAFFQHAYFANHATCVRPDVHGADALCSARFLQFRDWLVARANAAGDRQIVNGTDGGILHGGRIVQSTLEKAFGILPVAEYHISDRLTEAWKKGTRPNVESLRRGLSQVLQRDGAQAEELQRWAEFGKDTVSGDEIEARATLVLNGLSAANDRDISAWTERLTTLMRNSESAQQLALAQQLNIARRERDEARGERDAALAAKDRALVERDTALAQSDVALVERDSALAGRDSALEQLDDARRERDLAIRRATA